MSELDILVSRCKKGYDEYNFFIPAVAIREFMWNLFAAHYMEMVKSRAYGDGVSAEQKIQQYLHYTKYSQLSKTTSSYHAFISDKIWMILYSSSSIHAERQVESTGAEYDQSNDCRNYPSKYPQIIRHEINNDSSFNQPYHSTILCIDTRSVLNP